MSSKLLPVIWLRVLVTLAYMKGRTDVRCTYVRTVDDVMAIKPNFLASMGYQYFLRYGALRARLWRSVANLKTKVRVRVSLFHDIDLF